MNYLNIENLILVHYSEFPLSIFLKFYPFSNVTKIRDPNHCLSKTT